jgi:hypothetical protein
MRCLPDLACLLYITVLSGVFPETQIYMAKSIGRYTFCGSRRPPNNVLNGVLTPVDGAVRPSVVVPESMEEPLHFCHLVWIFGLDRFDGCQRRRVVLGYGAFLS